MKAKELAEELLKNPESDIVFNFSEIDREGYGYDLRSFINISVSDIGHSDKVIILGGIER